MLSISQSQLNGLRDEAIKKFSKELADRARDVHAEIVADVPEDQLLETMEAVIEAARARGLKKRSLMERFSDLSLALGVGFEESEDWAKTIFDNDELHPIERLDNAEATAIFVLREG